MFIFLIFMEFIAFPERKDAILSLYQSRGENINIEASGSIGIFFNSKCHLTHPNQTLSTKMEEEWCSNIGHANDEKPWLSFNIENKVMQLTAFSLRNGCCKYACCCLNDSQFFDGTCCCTLYSFSLQGSNDNTTWKVIHKVEKDKSIYPCKTMTFSFPKTESFKFVRLALDEGYPNCPKCLQINQVELYGKLLSSSEIISDYDESDESVSIIGKVRSKE